MKKGDKRGQNMGIDLNQRVKRKCLCLFLQLSLNYVCVRIGVFAIRHLCTKVVRLHICVSVCL